VAETLDMPTGSQEPLLTDAQEPLWIPKETSFLKRNASTYSETPTLATQREIIIETSVIAPVESVLTINSSTLTLGSLLAYVVNPSEKEKDVMVGVALESKAASGAAVVKVPDTRILVVKLAQFPLGHELAGYCAVFR
jgi:hypothetical protein